MFAVFLFDFFLCFLGFSLNFVFLHYFFNFSFLHVSCLFLSFLFNFSVCYCFLLDVFVFFEFFLSSYESFSSFLVFPSRAGGFGLLSRRGCWPFLLGKVLAIFGAGVAPSFSSSGLALPVGLALPSLGRGRNSFSGEGWPFGSGLARPQGGKPAKKGRLALPSLG